MKYKTYKKIRNSTALIRRIIQIIAIIAVMIALVIIALTAVKRTASAAAATQDTAATEPVEAETFEPLECDLPVDLQEYTYYICQHSGVDFALVMAVMYTESGFDPEAVSATGDRGLMQINEINLAELTDELMITDISDPYQNIRSGIYLLEQYTKKYKDAERVLMAYNMGDYGSSVLWEEGVHTTAYTDKVLTKYKEYKEATHGKRKEM